MSHNFVLDRNGGAVLQWYCRKVAAKGGHHYMSQYDVKVYIPKDLYKKLHYIASSGGISVPALLGRIIKDDSVIKTIDSAYQLLKQVKEGGNE